MKNWKTSLLGLIGGVAMALQGVQSHNWQDYLSAGAITALGLFAKDHNVTGGSTQQ